MKSVLALVIGLMIAGFCTGQVDKAPRWHADDSTFVPYSAPLQRATIGVPTGRIRTINTRFITIYSPKELGGYVTQKEMKSFVGDTVYLYWEDIVYFRLLGPFKKRKEYQLREVYNPGL